MSNFRQGFPLIRPGRPGWAAACAGMTAGGEMTGWGNGLLVAEEFAGENDPEGKQSDKGSGGGDGNHCGRPPKIPRQSGAGQPDYGASMPAGCYGAFTRM